MLLQYLRSTLQKRKGDVEVNLTILTLALD
jgi:hypothetical protein